jgi:hypothetical protein
MGKFQLELIYLYFPPSSHLILFFFLLLLLYNYIIILDGTTVENKGKLIHLYMS